MNQDDKNPDTPGEIPDIPGEIPESTGNIPDSPGDHISACDDFCDAWLDGKHPDIESLIKQYPSHEAEIRSQVNKFMATYRYFNKTRGERLHESLPQESEIENEEGRTLGDFRLIREIGRGGMGVVYEARQISLDRIVALKVLPAHLTLQEKVVQRFQREAATAAKLKHPGIVEVYSVGEEDGHHYFAMEFVEGAPLDRVIASTNPREAETKGASLLGQSVQKERHLLTDHEEPEAEAVLTGCWQRSHFEAVCRIIAHVADALEYAHKAGVIHRDVKPSNVLVREDGSIKLADFGLAHREGLSSLTMTGQLSGTPHYIAPELASKQQKTSDAQTDIYALGITLYELLTLTRPFEGRTSQEVLNNIITREPTSPRVHNTLIPRDLETICMTAVDKNRSRRYESAKEFKDDLLRFLSFKPIKAQPAGMGTHVYRMARRNPALTTIVGLLFLLVVVGPLIFGIQQKLSGDRIRKALQEKEDALRAKGHALMEKDSALKAVEEERDAKEIALDQKESALKEKEGALKQAEREATMAMEVSNFLIGLFRKSDPFVSRGEELTAYDLLQKGSASVMTELAGQTEIQVRLMSDIGISYKNLGYHDEAEALLTKAVEISRAELGEAHEVTIRALCDLVDFFLTHGRNAEARPLLTEALAQIPVLKGNETNPSFNQLKLEILEMLRNSYIVEGQLEEAEQICHRILAMVNGDSGIGADVCKRKDTMIHLGNIYSARGHLEDAESMLLRSYELSSEECRCGRWEDYQRFSTTALGKLYTRMGKFEKAEPYLLDAYEQALNLLGEDHFITHFQAIELAQLYFLMNRLEKLETLLLKSIQGSRTPLHYQINAASLLALSYVRQARFDEAEALLTECLDRISRHGFASLPDGFLTIGAYDGIDFEDLQPGMKEGSSSTTTVFRSEIPSASFSLIHVLRVQLGDLYAMQGKHDELVALYEKAVEENRNDNHEISPAVLDSLHQLTDTLFSTNRYEEAAIIMKRVFHEYPDGHPEQLRLCALMHSLKSRQAQEILPEGAIVDEFNSWMNTVVFTTPHKRISLITGIDKETAQAFLLESEKAYHEIVKFLGLDDEWNRQPITIYVASDLDEYNRAGKDFGDGRSSLYPVFFVEVSEAMNPFSVTYLPGNNDSDIRFASGFVRHAVVELYLNLINDHAEIPTWFIKGQAAKYERYFHPEYIKWSIQEVLIPSGGFIELDRLFEHFGYRSREIHMAGLICAYLDSEAAGEGVKTSFDDILSAIAKEEHIAEAFNALEEALIEDEENIKAFFGKF